MIFNLSIKNKSRIHKILKLFRVAVKAKQKKKPSHSKECEGFCYPNIPKDIGLSELR
jgi:hypothetical protein